MSILDNDGDSEGAFRGLCQGPRTSMVAAACSTSETNDTLKSNLHRVVEPSAERELPGGKELTQERYSIPSFVQADRGKTVECVEKLKGEGARYPPVSAGEYINMHGNAAFMKF